MHRRCWICWRCASRVSGTPTGLFITTNNTNDAVGRRHSIAVRITRACGIHVLLHDHDDFHEF